MLQAAHAAGRRAALIKLGLDAGIMTNHIDGGFEQHQSIPWDHTTDAPQAPTETAIAMGRPVGTIPGGSKAAALGLRDMLFFENMMGPDEARSMFQGVQKQMSGQGGGTRSTLQIGPGGVQRMPHPPRASSMPPPKPGPMQGSLGTQAASHVISSAPPPPPLPLRRG